MTSIVVPDKAVPRRAESFRTRNTSVISFSFPAPVHAAPTIPSPAPPPADGTPVLDIRAQPRAVIDNIGETLAAMDATLADLVDISTFLVDMDDFGGYNEVYAEYFDYDGPTRTTVAVCQLPHPDLLIEIKAIAHKPR